MRRLLRPRFMLGFLVISGAVSIAALLGSGVFQSATQAQGAAVTLQQGGNNVVYQGDALPVPEALGGPRRLRC